MVLLGGESKKRENQNQILHNSKCQKSWDDGGGDGWWKVDRSVPTFVFVKSLANNIVYILGLEVYT